MVLVINITTKREHSSFAKAELLRIRSLVTTEEGCIQFELLEDPFDSTRFIIYESWESKELWQYHLSSEHMVDFNATMGNIFTQFDVREMNFA